MKKNLERLEKLSFTELYNIYKFLKEEVETVSGDEKRIINDRILVIEEHLKQIVNNLF